MGNICYSNRFEIFTNFVSEQELQDWCQKSKILHIHDKPYIIIKELGFGGSSKVYEALDVRDQSIKAIKEVTCC